MGSHYLPGQTWNSVFGKLAGTVEECRAILVSEYLMDNEELLGVFGYTGTSEITAEDRTLFCPNNVYKMLTDSLLVLYATYLQIGVDGLQALEHYNAETQSWGQVHHQV